MKTISFQGTRLTDADRRKLAQQQRFLNPHLSETVSSVLAEDADKSTGTKSPRWWSVERVERGTPYVGDIITR